MFTFHQFLSTQRNVVGAPEGCTLLDSPTGGPPKPSGRAKKIPEIHGLRGSQDVVGQAVTDRRPIAEKPAGKWFLGCCCLCKRDNVEVTEFNPGMGTARYCRDCLPKAKAVAANYQKPLADVAAEDSPAPEISLATTDFEKTALTLLDSMNKSVGKLADAVNGLTDNLTRQGHAIGFEASDQRHTFGKINSQEDKQP